MSLVISSDFKGISYSALSGILYGSLGYFGIKLLESGFSIYSMLFWRFLIAAIMLVPLISQKSAWERTKLSSFLILVTAGGLTYALTALFYFMAAECLGTGIAMVIFFNYPLFVALLAWLVDGHVLGKVTLGAMVGICIGLTLLADHQCSTFTIPGFLLALLSGFTYAGYVFLGDRIKANFMVSTFAVCLGSALFFLPFSLYNFSSFVTPMSLSWLHVLAISIVSTSLPIILLLKAMKYIDATKASIISVLEPVTTVLVGAAFLHEVISLKQAIGVVIILGGAILVHYD